MAVVTESFTWGRLYDAGDVVDNRDPAVRKFPQFFESDAPVERATARPGQKRSTRRINPKV